MFIKRFKPVKFLIIIVNYWNQKCLRMLQKLKISLRSPWKLVETVTVRCWDSASWKLTIFKKSSILDIKHGFGYVSELGAVYMRWDISPRWDVSPEWDTFHSAFIWEKYPTWVSHLSSQLACMPIFKYLCCFHYLLILFLFQFRIRKKIFGYKFYEMNCTFLPNNYQNKLGLN